MRRGKRIIHNDTNTPDKQACLRLGCGHVREKHKGECKALHYDPFGPAVPCKCTTFVEPPAPAPDAKPLADLVTMRLRWVGEAPKIGEWLMGQGATARFAYRIITVRDTESPVRTFQIEAIKIPRAEKPADAVTHPLTWDSRNPTKGQVNKGVPIKQGAGWGNEP